MVPWPLYMRAQRQVFWLITLAPGAFPLRVALPRASAIHSCGNSSRFARDSLFIRLGRNRYAGPKIADRADHPPKRKETPACSTTPPVVSTAS